MAAQASWGLAPPPGPLRFLVFVSPRSLAAERGPGRPQTEKSIRLGPGCRVFSLAKIDNLGPPGPLLRDGYPGAL